jgi:hypothetical protein
MMKIEVIQGRKNKKFNPLISVGYFYFIYRLEIHMHVYMDRRQYKATLCPVHAMNTYREGRSIALLIPKKGTS